MQRTKKVKATLKNNLEDITEYQALCIKGT